ncbi:MAG: hypothetical protein JJE17_10560 [Peptostreptococcaceae bacterium]|nr:hypothetical protein [Peptostreptococcaceae bacterium]
MKLLELMVQNIIVVQERFLEHLDKKDLMEDIASNVLIDKIAFTGELIK